MSFNVGMPDALETRYAIDELSALAGVTPRTVRYYIAQGVLDRPEGEKRGAHYLPRHLEQLLQIRRWSDAGLSLDRIRELRGGSPDDPPPRPLRPGAVEVWSRVLLADGLELHLEPSRAGLSPEQVRKLVREVTALYRRVREEPGAQGP
jgi:DNA-binding transcriptional MerR regulator